uniref:Uncharacterized protein n=1 Tax=Arundo donax TaxID=35708 RepID=A0A0A8Y8M2_ARUDO
MFSSLITKSTLVHKKISHDSKSVNKHNHNSSFLTCNIGSCKWVQTNN